jgi:hypothetical protein
MRFKVMHTIMPQENAPIGKKCLISFFFHHGLQHGQDYTDAQAH